MMYNENEFFLKCCNALDDAFDKLPPPKPSRRPRTEKPMTSMSVFNNAGGACFAASSHVLLADGHQVLIAALREGAQVQTPAGPRLVRAVMKTRVRELTMCRVGGALATPWHPVRLDDCSSSSPQPENNNWVHPAHIAQEEDVLKYSGDIYSVLLERDSDPEAHAIRIGGVWGVTLGHGILEGSGDVRAHQFLGDYNVVAMELAMLGPDEYGIYRGAGVRRDPVTGKVCGFQPLQAAQVHRSPESEKIDDAYCCALCYESCA
jgi:hypothetical protein